MDATELVFLMVKSITLKQVTNGGFFHWLTRDVQKLKKIITGEYFSYNHRERE